MLQISLDSIEQAPWLLLRTKLRLQDVSVINEFYRSNISIYFLVDILFEIVKKILSSFFHQLELSVRHIER